VAHHFDFFLDLVRVLEVQLIELFLAKILFAAHERLVGVHARHEQGVKRDQGRSRDQEHPEDVFDVLRREV